MIRRVLGLSRLWAWSRRRSHRWRLVSLGSAAAVGALVIVLGWGYVLGAQRVDERQAARQPMVVEASGQRPAGELRMVLRGMVWDGVQTPVVWLDGDESSPVPPGLDRLPEPGTVVVSPAMRDAGFADGTLGLRLGDAGSGDGGAMGQQGLATRSEWLAYARPAAGRSLGDGGAIFAVRGFGAKAEDGSWPLLIETTEPGPTRRVALLVGGLLALVPALVLLTVAGGAMSGLLQDRFAALERQGLRTGDLALLAVLESAWITVPCAAVGATLGWWMLRTTGDVPLSGLRLVPGDLRVPSWSVAVAVILVAGIGAVGAVTSAVGRGRPSVASGRGPVGLARVCLVGLAMALVLMVISRQAGAPPVLLFALALAAVTIPFAVPALVERSWTGADPGSAPHVWLAVRRVVSNPVGLSRPAGVIAALLLGLLSFSGLQGQLMRTEAATAPPEVPTTIGWRDPEAGDVQLLRRAAAPDVTLRVHPVSDGTREVEVSGPRPARKAVVEAAYAHLPAANVFDPTVTLDRRHDARWYLGWGVMAGTVLCGAALIAFGNRALALAREGVGLSQAGLSAEDVRLVARYTVSYPGAVAIVIGTLSGSIFLWAAGYLDLAASTLGLVVGEVVLVSILMGGAIWAVDRVDPTREPLEGQHGDR